jgi:hypothetical protein
MSTQFSLPLAAANVISAPLFWPGGTGILAVAATAVGTMSLTLQYLLPDGVTFTPVAAVTAITAVGFSAQFTLPPGKIQLVNGGTGNTGLIVNALVIPTNLN